VSHAESRKATALQRFNPHDRKINRDGPGRGWARNGPARGAVGPVTNCFGQFAKNKRKRPPNLPVRRPNWLIRQPYIGGRMTLSITWITPFDAMMSAVEITAPFTLAPPSSVMVTSAPLTVLAIMPSVRSVDITAPGTT
jgi:hypothetical protein